MEKFVLTKQDGRKTACAREIPEDPRGIAVVLHGFTSSKESPTVQLLLRRLPAAGIGVVAIDLPGHGTEESLQEELRIKACMDSLEAAEEYAAAICPGKDIYYFASSFGAYITALYLSTRAHRGKKAFFRSAAVNMPSLFAVDPEHPTEQQKKWLDELEEKGYICPSLDLGSSVKVTKSMLEDLAENDLFEKFSPKNAEPVRIAMAHGREDAVIDPKEAERFSRQFDIPVTFFDEEGHSLSNDPATPDKVADLAAAWYLQP